MARVGSVRMMGSLPSRCPIDMPSREAQLATGLPTDFEQPELRAWLKGNTTLDHRARLRWAIDQVSRLQIRSGTVIVYHFTIGGSSSCPSAPAKPARRCSRSSSA